MQTEAVFENIADRIQAEIQKANKSIFIAVAWFTNKNIFNELLEKARTGCSVSLIISNDNINLNSQNNFNLLEQHNSKYYKIGNGDTELMHNKFCIIDYCTVITGSYNWSYKAESNFENIIINYNDTVLAEQFIAEFNDIRKKFYPDEPITGILFPLDKIIKRLEILKNYIALEDIYELNKEVIKISEYRFNSELSEIINDINKQEFASAINKIQNFIAQNKKLGLWNDPEILALKFEIKKLENQLNAFDNEKTELEKTLSEFHSRHTFELGTIILEILKLRKLKFKTDKEKFKEAENDEQQYNEQVKEEKEKHSFKLTAEERDIIKRKFRQATFLCHPDKLEEQFKESAQKIFIELKSAYDLNDLQTVSEILNNLGKGNLFNSKSNTISEKEDLRIAILKLRQQIKSLETEILTIKTSETFITLSNIEDWGIYFTKTKQKLVTELQILQKEIEV